MTYELTKYRIKTLTYPPSSDAPDTERRIAVFRAVVENFFECEFRLTREAENKLHAMLFRPGTPKKNVQLHVGYLHHLMSNDTPNMCVEGSTRFDVVFSLFISSATTTTAATHPDRPAGDEVPVMLSILDFPQFVERLAALHQLRVRTEAMVAGVNLDVLNHRAAQEDLGRLRVAPMRRAVAMGDPFAGTGYNACVGEAASDSEYVGSPE